VRYDNQSLLLIYIQTWWLNWKAESSVATQ
jgi:hypothetical protein